MRQALALSLILTFAAGAMAWAGFVLRLGPERARLDLVAARLTNGQSFPAEELENLQREAATTGAPGDVCMATRRRSEAIVSLGIYEARVGGRQDSSGTWMEAHTAVTRALACLPTDGFLWLALFRLETAVQPLSGLHLDYLMMSFRLAPNEGWVMRQRLKLAGLLWSSLPEEVRTRALVDLTTLVKRDRYQAVLDTLDTVSPDLRGELLQALSGLPSSSLDKFAKIFMSRDRAGDLPDWLTRRYCPTLLGRRDARCAGVR